MKKVLRSTFGTLMVAAFLAIVPPTYARGGHGGGHGGQGGHAVKGRADAAHVKGGHDRVHGCCGRGHQFARAGPDNGPLAGRAGNWNGARCSGSPSWGGSYWY